MTDATFEDGREAPLNLGAEDSNDLQVISTLGTRRCISGDRDVMASVQTADLLCC